MPRHKILSDLPGKAQSFFGEELSYNLQRPYPFHKRFKRCVAVGIVLFLAVFTVFNLATTGFDMQPEYTTNPNGTESHRRWFNNKFFTWNDDTLDPKCEHLDIPVGYDFMTTNLGLRYTVTGVSFHSDPSNSKANSAHRSSLSYHNNTLTDCEVSMIDIDLRKSDDTTNCNSCWWSWMDSSADATVQCKIANEEGLFVLSFKTHYKNLATLYNEVTLDNSIPSSPYSYLIVDDPTTHASIWWGARLLNNYFLGIQYMMATASPSTQPWKRAGMTLTPVKGKSIENSELFTLRYFTLSSTGSAVNAVYSNPSGLYNNETLNESRPLTEALFFAKVFRSLLLVDLGNSHTENVLLDPKLLQYVLNPPDNFNRQTGGPLRNTSLLDWWKYQGIAPPGEPAEQKFSVPMAESYTKFKNLTGPLSTQRASIYAQYICSVAQWKSKSTVTLVVLVANFALFQTAWMIFKWLADQLVKRSDPNAMYCEGCLKLSRGLVTLGPEEADLSVHKRHKRESTWSISSTQGLLEDHTNGVDSSNG
ncbi:uncharacterized protein BDR25DRAFT_14566 [Lindgomyces ingoldianus]|uniref:Uncharacterized protein n=1 Tax=Lindgomyces ingoldianus TaxID=673940 RepID=A0ACB6R102_9PLEO|nr:uncharacterized protein BDR25DRAFT_14566 [Lindgomyces ingoldianus]KAF2472465.1 hypothetical protein BDR25DRAFT_14566 [Lindgomyces ingoldianus]